jgi:L-2-hydroxyglutarate oxidase LhgO
MTSADFVVVGAGVMGVTIATELRRRHPDASVMLLEKEDAPGRHASGRNSGVLHAGFYYGADSLKARFSRVGNQRMREYCEARSLPIHRCGKLVVAQNEAEHAGLDELLRRARNNGVTLQSITEAEAREIEPRVRTCGRALFSPTTSTVDPKAIMKSLVEDAARAGVEIHCATPYVGREGKSVRTATGTISFGFLVNAAGLHADRVARDFGHSADYRILPFKGLYLYSNEPAGAFRTNIYPVPNLLDPFLGVHFTVTVDGHAKIGPTAIPCLWREQYQGWDNFVLADFTEILGLSTQLFLRAGFDFRRLAWQEMQKYVRSHLVGQAAALADGVKLSDYTRWGPPGIRAQLVNVRTRTLEQDFVIQGDDTSLHVLNAVSPGWTCALPFGEYVCDHIDRTLEGRAEPEPAARSARA